VVIMARGLPHFTHVVVLATLVMSGCSVGATSSPAASSGIPATPPPSASASAVSNSPTPTVAPLPTATPIRPATPSPTPALVAYTVVAGDSLSLIARRFDTTWQSLVFWNRDRYPSLDPGSPTYDPGRIQAGWQLLLRPGVAVAYEPPLPAPSTPAPGNPSVAVFHGDRTAAMVALTFDMGGRTEPAVEIMSWLTNHRVPATIFMTGSSVDGTVAGRDVVSIINAHPDLFELGNHSYSHPDMATLGTAQVADELRRAEAAIGRYADQSPRPLFRPPYGSWDADVLAGAGSAGYPSTVLWDVDTIDWKAVSDGGPTAEEIVARVRARAQAGSIVLMHLGGYETLSALPDVVSELRARGLSLVTLGSLIR
jgi:peptidoglycan/xylan/chitin deacetylase (PgdA/CDA1 family)